MLICSKRKRGTKIRTTYFRNYNIIQPLLILHFMKFRKRRVKFLTIRRSQKHLIHKKKR